MNGGVLAVGGALALVALASSHVAAREERRAERDRAYAEAEHAAFETRSRAYDIAMRARAEDGPLARVKAWSRAALVDPTWPAARIELAEARLDRAREIDAGGARTEREAAVRDADEAIARGGGARAYYARGRAFDDLGDDRRARESFFEAARTATWEDAFIRHASLAAVAVHDKRWRDAVDESARALEESPNAPDVKAWNVQASTALRSGR